MNTETTTRSIIRHAQNKMGLLASYGRFYGWENMAIEARNDLLDEYRRAEQTIESLAEQKEGRTMNFTATLRGVSFTDPKEFAAAVKAAPPLEPYTWAGKVVTVKTCPLPAKPKLFEKPRIVLTAAEREWLGATVRRSDGAVGQVWALAPIPGYVWVVADGDHWFQVHTDALEKLHHGLDPLPLSL